MRLPWNFWFRITGWLMLTLWGIYVALDTAFFNLLSNSNRIILTGITTATGTLIVLIGFYFDERKSNLVKKRIKSLEDQIMQIADKTKKKP
jgi:membrane-bound acyltransferase YfiQ involved in biofilm formation